MNPVEFPWKQGRGSSMKRRDFVRWSLTGTAALPLLRCSTSSSGPSDGVRLSAVSLNPAALLGGGASTGTVTLTGSAPAGGMVIGLTSSNTAAAQVPASVTVAAGAMTATFTVTTSPV